nr:DNA cytosine methyltransferase [Staphylococcus epidermidis]
MDVVSLFSGVGGFEEGFKSSKLDTNVVFASEIDKFAKLSYKTNFGLYPEGDIKKVHEFLIPDHQLLTAGFPCQSFSIAGKRLGFEDTRGTLFFDIARILDWKRPKFIILENVKNLISHDKGKTIKRILTILSEMNYSIDFKILNSKYFGTAQSRERIYIIGILNYKKEKYILDHQCNRKLNALKNEVNSCNNIKKFNFDINTQENLSHVIKDIKENENSVDSKYYLNNISTSDIKKIYTKEAVKDKGIIKLFDIPKSMHNDNERQRRVYSINGLAPTVLARTDSAKILVEKNSHYLIRKLTPLECFRLQGFQDSFFYNLKKAGLSDSQLYKQAGNAVTINVITSIANEVYKILGE